MSGRNNSTQLQTPRLANISRSIFQLTHEPAVTRPKKLTRFSEEQKRECCVMISIGCDRETACNYLGKTPEELRVELQQDPEFGQRLLRAEATPEFNHMRNLFNAAKEEKNWRASVWWLERRSPERYARRPPDAVSSAQLQHVIEELTDAIVGEVDHHEDRHRLLNRLRLIAKNIHGNQFSEISPTPTAHDNSGFESDLQDSA